MDNDREQSGDHFQPEELQLNKVIKLPRFSFSVSSRISFYLKQCFCCWVCLTFLPEKGSIFFFWEIQLSKKRLAPNMGLFCLHISTFSEQCAACSGKGWLPLEEAFVYGKRLCQRKAENIWALARKGNHSTLKSPLKLLF